MSTEHVRKTRYIANDEHVQENKRTKQADTLVVIGYSTLKTDLYSKS